MPPYYSTNKEVLYQNIKHGALKLPSTMSDEARDLIVQVSFFTLLTSFKLLNRNPVTRLGGGPSGAEEIKAHPFLKGIKWQALEEKRVQMPKAKLKTIVN